MLAAVVSALILQQAQPGQVVWATPPEPVVETAAAPLPPIPDWARADPFGYERSECSPLIRKATETMPACQARVRSALAAHLGDALPDGLAPGDANADNCRQAAGADGRYEMRCDAPIRDTRNTAAPEERVCETRPRAQPQGGVVWTEECRPASGRRTEDDGLRVRLGGRD